MKFALTFPAIAIPYLCAVTLISAQEPVPASPTVTPTLATIESFDAKDRLGKLLYTESHPVWYEVQREVAGPDGKPVTIVVKACKYVCELKLRMVTITGVREASGDQLTDEQIAARLQKGTPIVVVPHGTKIDPAYRQVFAKDALLVYITMPPPPKILPSAQ